MTGVRLPEGEKENYNFTRGLSVEVAGSPKFGENTKWILEQLLQSAALTTKVNAIGDYTVIRMPNRIHPFQPGEYASSKGLKF